MGVWELGDGAYLVLKNSIVEIDEEQCWLWNEMEFKA